MPETQPVHEMAREVAMALVNAREQGETVPEAKLREDFGLGHDDLRGILEQLAGRGMAQEVTPGDWESIDTREEEPVEADSGRVRVNVPEPGDEPEAQEEEPFAPEPFLMSQPTVRLTVAIADALDAEALGKLVKAGIEDSADDEVFVLEIVP